MPIQLTPEQEQRIQAVVNAGAYRSTEEAIDAALAAVESAAVPGFEGSPQELDALIQEGLNSGEAVQATPAFWQRLRAKTDGLSAAPNALKSRS